MWFCKKSMIGYPVASNLLPITGNRQRETG